MPTLSRLVSALKPFFGRRHTSSHPYLQRQKATTSIATIGKREFELACLSTFKTLGNRLAVQHQLERGRQPQKS